MSQYLKADELAKHFRVRPSTILAWQRKGLIPCLRATRRPVLFDLDAVIEALECPSDQCAADHRKPSDYR